MWKYDIYSPENPSTAVDLLVKQGDKWITIQVKTTFLGEGIRLKRESRSTGENGKGVYSYKEGDFDYLFGVKFPKVYIIPFNVIKRAYYVGFKDYEDYSYDLNNPEIYNYSPKL